MCKIVATSNVQSIPCIVKDGINRFLVEPKSIHKIVDIIEFALQNEDKFGFVNLNAQNSISNFCSTNNVAKKMIEIYCDMLRTV